MNWKDLKTNPPMEDCPICIMIADGDTIVDYRTADYIADRNVIRNKLSFEFSPDLHSCKLLYINLNEIKQ